MQRYLTSIRFDPKQHDALQKISERERRTMSWLVREAVAEFIERDGRKNRRKRA
jgi:predicted transcriptional regulator